MVVDVELYYCEKSMKIELKVMHVPANLMIISCTFLSDYPNFKWFFYNVNVTHLILTHYHNFTLDTFGMGMVFSVELAMIKQTVKSILLNLNLYLRLKLLWTLLFGITVQYIGYVS